MKIKSFLENIRENQKIFVLLHYTIEYASDILERRALLKLDLLIKFSQSLNRDKEGSNNAHATDIYYPERENYILAWREWLLLICPHGNARSQTER